MESHPRPPSVVAKDRHPDAGGPPDLFIRTADAVHLATAHEIGERDVWTDNRHMFAAAAYFGITGRSA